MKDQQAKWTEELGRLVALAERFASEGQMNLNKLLEAAIYAQVRWPAGCDNSRKSRNNCSSRKNHVVLKSEP